MKLSSGLKELTTSKLLLWLVMLTYFVGLFVGIHVTYTVIRNYPEYVVAVVTALFTYIAAPVGVAIGFYSWKAKNENVQIKQNNIMEDVENDEN